MDTIADRRNRVEQRAVANMQRAFYFYEKANTSHWDTRQFGWNARAERYAKAAEYQFSVARKNSECAS